MTTELTMLSKQIEHVQYWTEKLGEPTKVFLTEEIYKGHKGIQCDLSFRAKHGTIEIDIFQSYEQEVEFWDVSKTSPKAFHIVRLGYPDKFEGKVPEHAHTWEGRGYGGGHVSQSHWDTTQESKQAFSLLVEGWRVVDTTEEGHLSGYYPELRYWKE
jgi:hypothetical protein